jgi:hypothetical protein
MADDLFKLAKYLDPDDKMLKYRDSLPTTQENIDDNPNAHLSLLKPGDEGFDDVLRIVAEQNANLTSDIGVDVEKLALNVIPPKIKSVVVPWYTRVWNRIVGLFRNV